MRRGDFYSMPKMTFYPMAGSVSEQFVNLLQTLEWINSNNPTSAEMRSWLQDTFNLSHYFARDVHTVLLISSGLVKVKDQKCFLTAEGQTVLLTSSPAILLEVFEKAFAGVAGFLEVLRSRDDVTTAKLKDLWFDTVKDRFPQMQGWSKRTFDNQCRHRIDWLRAMGFIETANGKFGLSENGLQFVLKNPPEAIGIQPNEVKREEKELKKFISHDFQPFDVFGERTQSLRQVYVRDRAFRQIVTIQYDHYCAVCGFKLDSPRGVYEAQAAHIIPKHKRGSDDPRNGICMCRTCHWSFDEGIISIDAERFFVIAASYLKFRTSDASAGRLLKFQGKNLREVLDTEYAPSVRALAWHNAQVFLG